MMHRTLFALALGAGCRSPGASPAADAVIAATVDFAPCERAGLGPPPPPTPMTVAVTGRDVRLHVPPMIANCCPSPWATVTVHDAELHVSANSVTPGAESCRCFCWLPLDITLHDVPVGAWTAVVFDEKGREAARAPAEVGRR